MASYNTKKVILCTCVITVALTGAFMWFMENHEKSEDVEVKYDTTAQHVDVPDGTVVEQTELVENARHIDISTGKEIEANYDEAEEFVLYNNNYKGTDIKGFKVGVADTSELEVLDNYLGAEEATNSIGVTNTWVYGYVQVKNKTNDVVTVKSNDIEISGPDGGLYSSPTGMPMHLGTTPVQLGAGETGYLQVIGLLNYETYGIDCSEFDNITIDCVLDSETFDTNITGTETTKLDDLTTEVVKTNTGAVELRTELKNDSDVDWSASIWYYLYDETDRLVGVYTGHCLASVLKAGSSCVVSTPASYPFMAGYDQFDIARVEENCWIYYSK